MTASLRRRLHHSFAMIINNEWPHSGFDYDSRRCEECWTVYWNMAIVRHCIYRTLTLVFITEKTNLGISWVWLSGLFNFQMHFSSFSFVRLCECFTNVIIPIFSAAERANVVCVPTSKQWQCWNGWINHDDDDANTSNVLSRNLMFSSLFLISLWYVSWGGFMHSQVRVERSSDVSVFEMYSDQAAISPPHHRVTQLFGNRCSWRCCLENDQIWMWFDYSTRQRVHTLWWEVHRRYFQLKHRGVPSVFILLPETQDVQGRSIMSVQSAN